MPPAPGAGPDLEISHPGRLGLAVRSDEAEPQVRRRMALSSPQPPIGAARRLSKRLGPSALSAS